MSRASANRAAVLIVIWRPFSIREIVSCLTPASAARRPCDQFREARKVRSVVAVAEYAFRVIGNDDTLILTVCCPILLTATEGHPL